MSFLYLASPYTHPDPSIMELRYHEAQNALAWLVKRKIWAYSPIVHCHDLSIKHSLPQDHLFWRAYDRAMMDASREMLILTIPGWQESEGIADEFEYAHETGKPVQYFERCGVTYRIKAHPWFCAPIKRVAS